MGRAKPKTMQQAGLATTPAPEVNLVTPNKSQKSSPGKKFQKQSQPINIDAGSANTSKSKTAKKGKEESKTVERPVVMPKKPLSGYFMFSIQKMKAGFKNDLKVTERTKAVAAEWKLMTDADKQPYAKMAEDDKARFERETNELNDKGFFINSDGVKSTETRINISKLPMDTVKPKKPTNSLFLYIRASSEAFKAKNPGLKLVDMTKAMSEEFNNLSEKQKSKYTKGAADDKARYHKECEQLATLGYFIDSNGVKSTELEKKYTKSERKQIREENEKKKAEAQKEQEAVEKTTPTQYDANERETIGWEHYYTIKYADKMSKAQGKTEKVQKKWVDETLQEEWLGFSEKTKIKYINAGIKKKEEESEYNGTPNQGKKRAQANKAEEESQVTQKKTNKRQRVK